jgi:hypothetical protein
MARCARQSEANVTTTVIHHREQLAMHIHAALEESVVVDV